MDLGYKNQNVRGRKAFKKGQSLILFTVRKVFEQFCATSYIVSVIHELKATRESIGRAKSTPMKCFAFV